MLTNNTIAEAAYQNGTSYSTEFFELVVILIKFDLYHGLKLHLIHVAGTRMIEQGTYSLSRGNQL